MDQSISGATSFKRALITDALCDAHEAIQGALRPVLEQEICYLLSRRDPGRGGWRYFPELPELPPDADDLAQIVQVLWRSGHQEEIEKYCSGPLSILLEENSCPDGSFETWIIPSAGRTVSEAREAEFAKNMWGTGPDPDVMANVLYALALINPSQYCEDIDRGSDYLAALQTQHGCWNSTWYHGPFYGTYVCLRLLSKVHPEAETIQLAADFLRSKQNPDGGWGSEASNPLETSLALLGLAHLQRTACAAPDDTCLAAKGIAYLQATPNSDGSWSKGNFIRMDTGRASGTIAPVLSYGSTTVTTAFVLKAALIWDCLGLA